MEETNALKLLIQDQTKNLYNGWNLCLLDGGWLEIDWIGCVWSDQWWCDQMGKGIEGNKCKN